MKACVMKESEAKSIEWEYMRIWLLRGNGGGLWGYDGGYHVIGRGTEGTRWY